MGCGVACGFLQPVGVTVGAASSNVLRHMGNEIAKAVFFLYVQLHANGGRISDQTITARLIFFEGVDVGVIPKAHRFNAFLTQGSDAGKRAGSAAAMQ